MYRSNPFQIRSSSTELLCVGAIVFIFIALIVAAFVGDESDFSDSDRSSYSQSEDDDYDIVWVHDSSGSYQRRVYHPSRTLQRQSSSGTSRSSSGSGSSLKSTNTSRTSSPSRTNSNTSSGSRSSTSSGGSRKLPPLHHVTLQTYAEYQPQSPSSHFC